MNIKKILLTTLMVIVAIIIGIYFFLDHIAQRPVPDYNTSVKIRGMDDTVTIYRDQYAIPHIYASSEEDLYRAVGYVMAQDRMWQMDLLRRVTQGRLAEIFGEDFIETDHLLRALRFEKKSQQVIDSCSNIIINGLNAFADGFNQYLEEHKNKLPVEFFILGYKPEPWEIQHSVNLIGYMAWDLKAGWSQLLLGEIKDKTTVKKYMELLPDVARQNSFVFPDYDNTTAEKDIIRDLLSVMEPLTKMGLQVFNASNNWCVSGEKTRTGKPLFANDMHLGLNLPGIWYQMHQVVKGKLHVTGLNLPGQPFIIAGHNEHIAWGMTNTYVDNMDFYEEQVNPENKDQYKLNDQWLSFEITREIIKYDKNESVERTIKYTHRGPVISEFKDFDDKTVSMQWVGDLYSNEMRTIYLLNRAKDWEGFVHAVKTFKSISQNINYADIEGNIGLYCCAGVPVRNRNGYEGILPGNTDEYDWQGYIPFEELPYSYNPPSGHVASANNRTADHNYPYHIGTWYDLPYRIDRIRELISETDKFSMDGFADIQTDFKSKLVEDMLPEIIHMIEKNEEALDELELKSLNILRQWDYEMNADLSAPLIFESLYQEIIINLFKDEMGDELFQRFLSQTSLAKHGIYNAFKNISFSWCDDILTEDKIEELSDIVIRSYKHTIRELSDTKGDNIKKWKWGDMHQLTLEHPLGKVRVLDFIFGLNKGGYPCHGSFHTISPFSYNFKNRYKISHGASHRHIYDLSDWDNSLTVIPTGNSGIPASQHYGDQTDLYLSEQYHPDYFSKKKVISNIQYVMKIEPAY